MTDGRHPISDPPPEPGEAVPCLVHEDREATWISPTGHGFCDECRELYDAVIPSSGLQPVNLTALMSGERPEEDWCVAPVLPAGKLVGIVSKRGEGKSLLLLDMAAAKACGLPTLSQPAGEPIDVIYVDMEMGPDDLYERLADLGYLPTHPNFDALSAHLHYYQLVALPPLDTEAGGIALEELVERHGASFVVIDTVSRVISGNENDADPFRELFRHTETRLKRRRVTLARLDHLGKDKERGSRGSSAKEDPLDVVWHLTETLTGAIELTLTKGRQGWIPRSVTIYKEEVGEIFSHVIHNDETPPWLLELVAMVDDLGLAPSSTVNATQEFLKLAGNPRSRKVVSQIARYRRQRSNGSEPSKSQNWNRDENRQNQPEKPLTNEPLPTEPSENRQNQSQNRVLSLEERTGSDQDPENDYEPSLEDLENLPFAEEEINQ